MTDQKTVLLVDDEPNVIFAIRRLLRKEGWNLLAAKSGQEGLQIMRDRAVDVVVSDVRMPMMDGPTFLGRVKELYPETIRIILTGYADRDALSRAFAEADIHEMISKPWEDEELKSILRDAVARSDPGDPASTLRLPRVINEIGSLPAVPHVYAKVRELIVERAQEISAAEVAGLIERDPAMSARILQIANSAFFGQRRQIDTLSRAIVVLGMDMVETLVLSTGVFHSFETKPLEGFTQQDLWKHSLACGMVAKHLAEQVGANPKRQEAAMLIGSLHDMGKLVLLQYVHSRYAGVVRQARASHVEITEAERAEFGASHAEVGGYLADSWNLPSQIGEAIRWHANPAGCEDQDQELAYLIYVSDFLVHSMKVGSSPVGCAPGVDPAAFQKLGLTADFRQLSTELEPKLADLDIDPV